MKEIESGFCKLRWERAKEGYKVEDLRSVEEIIEADQLDAVQEALARDVYNDYNNEHENRTCVWRRKIPKS